MRSSKRWLAPALLAVLVLVAAAVAQSPAEKKQPARRLAGPPRITVDDVVDRIMRYDKNKDGKVTKDELPERMQHLIALGDTNKDGALDKAEIKKLATKLANAQGGFRVGGGFRAGPGAGPGAVQVRVGPGPGPDAVEGVVDDLKLSGKKKDQAMAVAKAHRENIIKLLNQARADLLKKMKQVLSKEEFEDFKAALDRPRGVIGFRVGPPGIPGPPDGERKRDPRQKD
jgi:hypothetical protein